MMTFALRLIRDELLEKRMEFKRSLVMPQNCSKTLTLVWQRGSVSICQLFYHTQADEINIEVKGMN